MRGVRISWLPRAVLIVRIRGVVRRYNASWLPWVVLVVLGWCVLHDHDREYANRYHDHYKISEMEDELRHHDSKIGEIEDELYSYGRSRMDELEDELYSIRRHDHDGEYADEYHSHRYADDDHSHSEYSWEGHEH